AGRPAVGGGEGRGGGEDDRRLPSGPAPAPPARGSRRSGALAAARGGPAQRGTPPSRRRGPVPRPALRGGGRVPYPRGAPAGSLRARRSGRGSRPGLSARIAPAPGGPRLRRPRGGAAPLLPVPSGGRLPVRRVPRRLHGPVACNPARRRRRRTGNEGGPRSVS